MKFLAPLSAFLVLTGAVGCGSKEPEALPPGTRTGEAARFPGDTARPPNDISKMPVPPETNQVDQGGAVIKPNEVGPQ